MHECALPFPKGVDTIMMFTLIFSARVKRFLAEIFKYYSRRAEKLSLHASLYWRVPCALAWRKAGCSFTCNSSVVLSQLLRALNSLLPHLDARSPCFIGLPLAALGRLVIRSQKMCSGRWQMLKNDFKCVHSLQINHDKIG